MEAESTDMRKKNSNLSKLILHMSQFFNLFFMKGTELLSQAIETRLLCFHFNNINLLR